MLRRLAALALLTFSGAGALLGGWSPSGWLIWATAGLASISLFAAPGPLRRATAAMAVGALLGMLALRFCIRGEHLVVLPGDRPCPLLARLIDEQDLSLIGARALGLRWRLPHDERAQLVPAMRDAYVAMRGQRGSTPSPVLDTLLGGQSPRAFDMVVFEPASPPTVGLVFLHGYAGSYTLPCWLMAEAAQAIGAVTICPAMRFDAHWWTRDGEHILRTAIDALHARGIRRIYLAGLSNGAVGAALLAPRVRSALAGLILVSGAPSDGEEARLPTLVVHGEADTIASPQTAHAFARRTGARYLGFAAGHFVLLTQRAKTRAAIAGWLEAREAAQPGR